MLRLKTQDGVQHFADLFELCEEAAGARPKPEDIITNLAGVVHRLLELHPLDEQTRVLKPLLETLNFVAPNSPSLKPARQSATDILQEPILK